MLAAAGDINGDGHADLAIADPGEPDRAADGTLGGRLLVRYGSARGVAREAEPVVPRRSRMITASAVRARTCRVTARELPRVSPGGRAPGSAAPASSEDLAPTRAVRRRVSWWRACPRAAGPGSATAGGRRASGRRRGVRRSGPG
ncbi:FG-GAP repeat protein [Streptomyces massasporeus]